LAKIPEPPQEIKEAQEGPKPGPLATMTTGIATLAGSRRSLRSRSLGESAAKSGESLSAGAGLEVTGAVTFVYADGTQVDVGSNTELRDLKIDGGKRFSDQAGDVRAVVAKQPKDQPMIVSTPLADAKVVGTSLRLVVEEGAKGFTRLEVTEGKVQLKRLGDGRTVDVPAGQYAVASAGLELAPGRSRPRTSSCTAVQARIVGKEWKIVRDAKTSTGQAMESIEMVSDDGNAR
jgi:ferric-dicitrate binding protein FerR (iron transport regulator)